MLQFVASFAIVHIAIIRVKIAADEPLHTAYNEVAQSRNRHDAANATGRLREFGHAAVALAIPAFGKPGLYR